MKEGDAEKANMVWEARKRERERQHSFGGAEHSLSFCKFEDRGGWLHRPFLDKLSWLELLVGG